MVFDLTPLLDLTDEQFASTRLPTTVPVEVAEVVSAAVEEVTVVPSSLTAWAAPSLAMVAPDLTCTLSSMAAATLSSSSRDMADPPRVSERCLLKDELEDNTIRRLWSPPAAAVWRIL